MRPVIERILVYIDGSEQSITAYKYALMLARATGASLCVLYVVNMRALDELVKVRIFLPQEQEEYARDLEENGRRYLGFAEETALNVGLHIETIYRKGNVHQEIAAAVKEMNIDLLVIGELSRLQSRRDILYDETERAMRLVDCSVLIVKNEERIEGLFGDIL